MAYWIYSRICTQTQHQYIPLCICAYLCMLMCMNESVHNICTYIHTRTTRLFRLFYPFTAPHLPLTVHRLTTEMLNWNSKLLQLLSHQRCSRWWCCQLIQHSSRPCVKNLVRIQKKSGRNTLPTTRRWSNRNRRISYKWLKLVFVFSFAFSFVAYQPISKIVVQKIYLGSSMETSK